MRLRTYHSDEVGLDDYNGEKNYVLDAILDLIYLIPRIGFFLLGMAAMGLLACMGLPN